MEKDLLQSIKECKTAEEVIAIAKENGKELSEEQANKLMARVSSYEGELPDSFLDTVNGGVSADKPITREEDGKIFVSDYGCCSAYVCETCGQTIATLDLNKEYHLCRGVVSKGNCCYHCAHHDWWDGYCNEGTGASV